MTQGPSAHIRIASVLQQLTCSLSLAPLSLSFEHYSHHPIHDYLQPEQWHPQPLSTTLTLPTVCLSPSSTPSWLNPLTSHPRNRQALPPNRPQGQGCSRREHGLEMRLYPTIHRARKPPQIHPIQASQRLHRPRFSLQPIRQPGPRLQR